MTKKMTKNINMMIECLEREMDKAGWGDEGYCLVTVRPIRHRVMQTSEKKKLLLSSRTDLRDETFPTGEEDYTSFARDVICSLDRDFNKTIEKEKLT